MWNSWEKQPVCLTSLAARGIADMINSFGQRMVDTKKSKAQQGLIQASSLHCICDKILDGENKQTMKELHPSGE